MNSAEKNKPDYVIDIVGLTKSFKRSTRRSGYTTIKSTLLSFFSPVTKKNVAVTHAIKDLTLRIRKGSAVGIIGRNGAGKSTLLKLISGIYKADQGTIMVDGRISALIELGAGFHPDFTGRENVYLAGAMHGLSKNEINNLFADIVAFAELEDYIDDPVRTYSSGMFMRLGFSIAIHTNPDVLIVDEVLAVGDAGFVLKCKEKILELFQSGKTLLFVSHDLDTVSRWCHEVVWINKGVVMDRGEPRRVIDHYLEFLERGEEEKFQEIEKQELAEPDISKKLRWGSHEIEIINAKLTSAEKEHKHVFHPEDSMTVEISFIVHEVKSDIAFGIAINRNDGAMLFGTNTDIDKIPVSIEGKKEGTVKFSLNRIGLQEGSYSIDIAVHAKDGYPYDYHKGLVSFAVRNRVKQVGYYVPEYNWEIEC